MSNPISNFTNIPNTEDQNYIFAIYLGGKHADANIEIHDLVFTTGATLESCYNFCIQNWFGTKKPHIDGYFQIETNQKDEILVDNLNSTKNSLFCLNFGGYMKNQLAEMHEFMILLAESKSEAIIKAKSKLQLQFDMLHLDNCFQIDEVIDISQKTGVHFDKNFQLEEKIKLVNCYIKL